MIIWKVIKPSHHHIMISIFMMKCLTNFRLIPVIIYLIDFLFNSIYYLYSFFQIDMQLHIREITLIDVAMSIETAGGLDLIHILNSIITPLILITTHVPNSITATHIPNSVTTTHASNSVTAPLILVITSNFITASLILVITPISNPVAIIKMSVGAFSFRSLTCFLLYFIFIF